MKIDMPYEKYRALVHYGLAALPSFRSIEFYVVGLGIIADPAGIKFFSRIGDYDTLAICTIATGQDVVVNEPGAINISPETLQRMVNTGRNSSYQLIRSWAERLLAPPLIKGHEAGEWRVRLSSNQDQSSGGTRKNSELNWDLYCPNSPRKGSRLSCTFACVPPDGRWIDRPAECILSINREIMRHHLKTLGNLFMTPDTTLEFSLTRGSCTMSICHADFTTTLDFPPGGYRAQCENIRLSVDCRDFVSSVGKAAEADLQICRFANGPGMDNKVRFLMSNHSVDCSCAWDQNPDPLQDAFKYLDQARPIVVDSAEMLQAACSCGVSKPRKIRIRLHHNAALLTFIRGDLAPKRASYGGVTAVNCQLPPADKGVSEWCVWARHLSRTIKTLKGTRIRISLGQNCLILDDPELPMVKHRLASLKPDELPADIEQALMKSEAGMVRDNNGK
jgi:hypothetical protein